MQLPIMVATPTGPFTHGETHSPARGLGRLTEISAEDGLYLASFTDEQVASILDRTHGWTDRAPYAWADGHGERGIWKDYGGNIWVAVTEYDIEVTLNPNEA